MPRKSGSSKINHTCTYKFFGLPGCFVFQAHFGSRDILMLGRSPIKLSPDMTIVVDRVAKPILKQVENAGRITFIREP